MVSEDLAYPYNLPPVGSKIVLAQQLSIEPGTTRAFLQRGKPTTLGDFNRYHANCNFEVRHLSSESQRIEPDTFSVEKVERLMTEVVHSNFPQPRVLRVEYTDPSSPLVTHGYHLWLGSDRQPEVMRLTCRGAFDDLSRAEPPSINEVREALGSIAELVLTT
jgi:hypothetical protein